MAERWTSFKAKVLMDEADKMQGLIDEFCNADHKQSEFVMDRAQAIMVLLGRDEVGLDFIKELLAWLDNYKINFFRSLQEEKELVEQQTYQVREQVACCQALAGLMAEARLMPKAYKVISGSYPCEMLLSLTDDNTLPAALRYLACKEVLYFLPSQHGEEGERIAGNYEKLVRSWAFLSELQHA